MEPDDDALSLHSAWFGIIANLGGALIVLAAGVLAVAGVGVKIVPSVVLAVGALLVIGVAFDYPVSSNFSVRGIERRPLLRRQLIPWDRIEGISRARPALRASMRGFAPGGLVAVVGRRRYLLVDRPESGSEHDRLVALIASWDLDLPLGSRPSDELPPTWLYRRARWAPDRRDDR